jgi:hypothetical protein
MLLVAPFNALATQQGMQQQASLNYGHQEAGHPLLFARRRTKHEICEAYLQELKSRGDLDCSDPGFVQSVRAHFDRLPTRYALDVNLQSLDVLSHKRLLDEARADPTAVSFAVRPVEIIVPKPRSDTLESPASPQVRGGTRFWDEGDTAGC